MTVEELKKEAKRLGYRVIKLEPMPDILPCVCGCKGTSVWQGVGYKYRKCNRCGRAGYRAKTERKAIEKWNESIRDELNRQKEANIADMIGDPDGTDSERRL